MRYIIGIDLGTTNSSVTYVDTESKTKNYQTFHIQQLTSKNLIQKLPTLPSFCFLQEGSADPQEKLNVPWDKDKDYILGVYALECGGKKPNSLVSSAKSWLCHSAISQLDPHLPVDYHDEKRRISALEATKRYLSHIKNAWNHDVAKGDYTKEFEQQEIIITVPASFNEISRRLTAEAAKLAGINKITFLEEPLAAFYNWLASHEKSWKEPFKDGDIIVVCDVGGGTTDFSLIQYQESNDIQAFNRVAVGDHLLLGGDNLDTALTYYLEGKISENKELSIWQWKKLFHEARVAKEKLLSGDHETWQVVLQGEGSSVVAGSMQTSITATEIKDFFINGFFPKLPWEQAIHIQKKSGIRSSGLPYEDDPSITKQLAHFLNQTLKGDNPTHLLFNGGTMISIDFQKAIIDSINDWFPRIPIQPLTVKNMELAVSKGAAYFGKVRRGEGVKVTALSPRSYYLELDTSDKTNKTLCIMNKGAAEGFEFHSPQTFIARANKPVSFTIYASNVRLDDKVSQMVDLNPEEMQPLPPLQTILRYGKSLEKTESIEVELKVEYTTLGILRLSLTSAKSNHEWILDFQLKSIEGHNHETLGDARTDESFDRALLNKGQEAIKELFKEEGKIKPAKIMQALETAIDLPKSKWPISILRQLHGTLLEQVENRKISSSHESRWWNLYGYFLRPGFGFPLDDHRIKELWRIYLSDNSSNKKTEECLLQQRICFRRVAGGLNKGQQIQLYHQIAPLILNKKKGIIQEKRNHDTNHYQENLRTLASLERIDMEAKLFLGKAIINQLQSGKGTTVEFWALGRIGARHLTHGLSSNVIPPPTVEDWINTLLDMQDTYSFEKLAFPLMMLAHKTCQKECDITESLRGKVIELFQANKHSDGVNYIKKEKELSIALSETILGDKLPPGLMLK